MKKEADVKARVKEILNGMGAWWFMYVPTGYGAAGIPDFLVCYLGRFVAIETKFGKNELTGLQVEQRKKMEAAYIKYIVINEKNVEELGEMIAAVLS